MFGSSEQLRHMWYVYLNMYFLCELIFFYLWLFHLQSYKELAESEKAIECLQKAIDLDDKYDIFLGSKILLNFCACSYTYLIVLYGFLILQYITASSPFLSQLVLDILLCHFAGILSGNRLTGRLNKADT